MAKLHELRPLTLDWKIVDGSPTLVGNTSYRIVKRDNGLTVQKRAGGDWRNDNGFQGKSLTELVQEINEKA